MGKGRQSQILGRSDTIHVCSLLTVATKLALILQLLVSANPTVWNLLIDHIADPVRIFPVLCRGSKLSSDETTSLSLVFVVGRRNRIVAGLADATLFCVRWRGTSRHIALHALERLEQAHANVVGAALTQVDVNVHLRSGYADAEVYHPRYGGYFRES